MRKRVIAWWSGGIASAVACKLALDEFGADYNVELVFIDTKNEHEDTYRFLKDCEKVYGQEILSISHPDYERIEDVWRKFKSLNVAKGAICSSTLKRKVRNRYEDKENDYAQIFGFDDTKQEHMRANNMLKNYPEVNPLFPLIDRNFSKERCIQEVASWGIEMPWAYKAGFRNNNCFRTGCVQGGIGYWQKIMREYPDKFERMAAMEHELTEARGEPVTMLSDRAGGIKRRLFLKPHPDYPELEHLANKRGRAVEPLMECNGFCSTDNVADTSADTIKDIYKLVMEAK